MSLAAWRFVTAVLVGVAGFAGGYMVGLQDMDTLRLRLQLVEEELRRAARSLDELEAARPNPRPPDLHYVPPEE